MYKIELTAEQLRRLTGLKESEIETQFADAEDPATVLLNAVGKKVKKIGDDKFGQGQKEKGEAVEAALKSLLDHYKVEQSATAEETIAAIYEKAKAGGESPGGGLTKETLQTNPIVRELIDAETARLRETVKAKEQELQAKITEVQSERVRTKAVSELAAKLKEHNAILGAATPEQAAEMLIRANGLQSFGLTESGALSIMENGKPAQDELGDALTVDNWLKSTWAFGFNAADPNKQGGGAPGAGTGGAGTGGGTAKYKTMQQAVEAANREADPKKRAELFNLASELPTE